MNTERENKSWNKEYIEFQIAYAVAQIDPQGSIEYLHHPLYQVRQAAIRAIAEKANGDLIKQVFEYHQDFNENDLPSPHPYAAYRALDLALEQVESGNKDDLSILKQIQKDPRLKILPIDKNNPTVMEQQRDAINQRLDWTIAELEYRLNEETQKTDSDSKSAIN